MGDLYWQRLSYGPFCNAFFSYYNHRGVVVRAVQKFFWHHLHAFYGVGHEIENNITGKFTHSPYRTCILQEGWGYRRRGLSQAQEIAHFV